MPLDGRPTSSGSSSADSSFVGSAAASTFSSSASNSDSEPGGVSRKRKATDAQEFGSGDEGVIDAGRKRKRKKGGKKRKKGEGEAGDGLEEDEGVGARVRRRRKGEVEGDRKTRPLPDTSTVTVDVDELWAQMNRAPEPAVAAGAPPSPAEKAETHADETEKAPESSVPPPDAPVAEANDPMAEDMICIKRTYVFAGETITEEKVVSKSSAEGRLHLESQSASPKPITSSNGKPLRRPLKRRSRFDPPPEPGTTGTAGSPSSSGFGSKDKGRKLNTVEKSKLDWAGYVDKTGIKEELTVAEKAKEGYLGKMDFLGRVDAKREDEISNSRKK